MATPLRSRVFDLLKMAAPYAAVLVGLVWLRHAWVTLLLYHGLIGAGLALETPRKPVRFFAGGSPAACLLLVPPAFLIVPLLLLLGDGIFGGGDGLGPWLAARGLHRSGLAVFLIYFALVNPVLEERHWGPLRSVSRHAWIRHAAFAGYHVPVLYTLLQPFWCGLTFVILLMVSWAWAATARICRGPLVPLLSHMAGDIAIAWGVYRLAG